MKPPVTDGPPFRELSRVPCHHQEMLLTELCAGQSLASLDPLSTAVHSALCSKVATSTDPINGPANGEAGRRWAKGSEVRDSFS